MGEGKPRLGLWGPQGQLPLGACLLLGVGEGERGVKGLRTPGQVRPPPAAAPGAPAPGSAASRPPKPRAGIGARPTALRASGARALGSSSEQLHNDASERGGAAAFVIATRLGSSPRVLINRSLTVPG